MCNDIVTVALTESHPVSSRGLKRGPFGLPHTAPLLMNPIVRPSDRRPPPPPSAAPSDRTIERDGVDGKGFIPCEAEKCSLRHLCSTHELEHPRIPLARGPMTHVQNFSETCDNSPYSLSSVATWAQIPLQQSSEKQARILRKPQEILPLL